VPSLLLSLCRRLSGAAHPPRPPPLSSVSPSPSSPSPLPSGGGGGREVVVGVRRRRPCGRCADAGGARRPPPSPSSSVRAPQRVLTLGSLCSSTRRNPRCLCARSDGESFSSSPPSSHASSPRSSLPRIFFELQILTTICMVVENYIF
jgi:hypothetical protein